MKLYGGIDLHSNNSVLALLDEEERLIYRKRLPNDATAILEALGAYREAIVGLVVESTYNWYWLVDALMEAGYRVHLANTAALVQYTGLKYSDDDSDARWLAELLHRGLLAEGYIYPKEDRAVRDLLRRRSRLVQQHTANLLAVQNLFARDRGRGLSANEVKHLTAEAVSQLLPDPNQALAVQGTLLAMRGQEGAIDLLERAALA
jgi:transposase